MIEHMVRQVMERRGFVVDQMEVRMNSVPFAKGTRYRRADVRGTTADASRVRLILEGSRTFEMGGGAVLTPGLELGLAMTAGMRRPARASSSAGASPGAMRARA